MKRDTGFHEYVMGDLFEEGSGVRSRAMFGGWGIYHGEHMFALIAEGELYMKSRGAADDAWYGTRGSHPFVYEAKGGKRTTMSYWLVPEEVQSDRVVFREWCDRAIRASQTAASANAAKKAKKK